jgi:CDP-diglyceride synthetase
MFGMQSVPFHDLFMMLILGVSLLILWKWHKSDNEFDLQQLIVDNTSGKLSIEKFLLVAAFTLSSWLIVGLFNKDKMTENYFGMFLGAFVAARAVSSGLTVLKDTKSPTPPVPPA